MKKGTMGLTIGAVSIGMLCAAFASKPLYDSFCRITGFGGTTRVAVERPDKVLDRHIQVRFDSNISDVPFTFRPLEPFIDTKVGESNLVLFEVTNYSDEPIRAIASYNVTPHKAGPYFTKLECFCFQEQVFEPGETVKLPVIFFVNPLIDEEHQLDDVKSITLSYTYFRAKGGNESLASFDDLVSEH